MDIWALMKVNDTGGILKREVAGAKQDRNIVVIRRG